MKRRMKRRTNIKLVKDIMEKSTYGALAQLFVLDAIQKLADAVAESKISDYPEHSLVAPEAWIAVAREIQVALRSDK